MSQRKLPGSSAGIAARQFCIYREVVIERLTQEVVAQRYEMTQGRVSQIVARVQKALDEAQPEDDSALVAAREARRTARECQERREHYLTLAAEGYRQSSQPLVTVKTRTRGEEEEFQEKTERPQKANVQFLKLMVKLNGELEEGSGLRVQGAGKQGASPAAGDKGQQTEERKPVTIANSRPTPTAEELAVERLASVRTGSGSLAEIETWNFVNQLSDGYEYPSYFENCEESINGVRVADWVREHVADELLPHGDEVWLPVQHNLKDFDGTDRELVQDDTSQRFFNPRQPAYHFGGKRSEVGDPRSVKEGEVQRVGNRVMEGQGDGVKEGQRAASQQSVSVAPSDSAMTPFPRSPTGPTRIERLLASERTIPGVRRRMLERVAARRRAAAQIDPSFQTETG